eukprot:SAG31_NODE_14204_length_821_cov_0.757618_1_plen_52_part_00
MGGRTLDTSVPCHNMPHGCKTKVMLPLPFAKYNARIKALGEHYSPKELIEI